MILDTSLDEFFTGQASGGIGPVTFWVSEAGSARIRGKHERVHDQATGSRDVPTVPGLTVHWSPVSQSGHGITVSSNRNRNTASRALNGSPGIQRANSTSSSELARVSVSGNRVSQSRSPSRL